MLDVLRFSFEDIGEQSVMIIGIILMPRLSASSWDIRKYQGAAIIINYENIRFTHTKASLVKPSNDPLDALFYPIHYTFGTYLLLPDLLVQSLMRDR